GRKEGRKEGKKEEGRKKEDASDKTLVEIDNVEAQLWRHEGLKTSLYNLQRFERIVSPFPNNPVSGHSIFSGKLTLPAIVNPRNK
ncbi:hypothetical protein ACQP3F_29565, partial [Escherichia coli]